MYESILSNAYENDYRERISSTQTITKNNQNEMSRSDIMKQINNDNDEMIKKLKRNIRENEKILFQRHNNIQKIKRELKNFEDKEKEREKQREKYKNEGKSSKISSRNMSHSHYNDDEDNSTEKSGSFWVPLDQPHELTNSQKQKAIKLNKRSIERANYIKRKHKDNDMLSFISKEDELNSWKPKYMPI